MSITVKVEVLGGDLITSVAHEMCQLATRIGANVEVKFNDVTCIAEPNAEPTDLIGAWYLAQKDGRQHKIVFARTRKETP